MKIPSQNVNYHLGKSFWCICNNIVKMQHLLPVQCLSVHDPHLITKAPLDWFPWNWCWVLLPFEIFQLQLKMESTKRHSTWKSVWASVSTLGLTCTKIFWKNVAFLCPRDYYISLTVLMIIIGTFVLPSHNVKTEFELCIWDLCTNLSNVIHYRVYGWCFTHTYIWLNKDWTSASSAS
jgi:hypothetical protein